MEIEEVNKIYKDHNSEFLKTDSPNAFFEGLSLLNALSASGKECYAAEHDIFYANQLDDLPQITEDHIIKLNRLGWHFDEEAECFANFV